MIGKHKLLALLLSLGTTLAYGPATAQTGGLDVKTAGDISYVSGGVGASEQEALEQIKPRYNLRLLFAVAGSGAFLAEVPVTIADPSGQVLVEAVSNGPYFYAKVPPGTYGVSAQNAGQVQTRSVTVPAAGAISVDFRWTPR